MVPLITSMVPLRNYSSFFSSLASSYITPAFAFLCTVLPSLTLVTGCVALAFLFGYLVRWALQLVSSVLSKVLPHEQDFHPLVTIIPSDLAVREAAKPGKRRASEDDTATWPSKKIMTVSSHGSRRDLCIATNSTLLRTLQCKWTIHRRLWKRSSMARLTSLCTVGNCELLATSLIATMVTDSV